MVAKFLDLNNLPWQRRPEETYGVLFCSWVQSCTGKSYMSSIFVFFFSAILAGLRLLLRSTNFATPKNPTTPPPPHTPYMQLSVYPFTQDLIPKCIFSKMSPLHLLLYKRRDLLILTDILHIANVFFRLQWYFCLFLGCFWESSSTVLSSYNV